MLLSLMYSRAALLAPDENSQGSGGASDQGGEGGGQGEGGESEPGKKAPEGGKKPEGGEGGGDKPSAKDQSMTPTVLKNVLDHQKRTLDDSLERHMKAIQKGVNERMKTLEETIAKEKKKPTAKDDEPPPEVAELRRELAEVTEKSTKLQMALEDSQQRDRRYRFENEVKAELSRQGCNSSKLDQAFLVVQPKLTHDEEGNRIFAVMEGEYGREEVLLNEWIVREAKENLIPEFFETRVKAGSAAGGDDGKGGGQFKFTKEQITNAEFYQKHASEIRAALEAGQVKGIDRPQS